MSSILTIVALCSTLTWAAVKHASYVNALEWHEKPVPIPGWVLVTAVICALLFAMSLITLQKWWTLKKQHRQCTRLEELVSGIASDAIDLPFALIPFVVNRGLDQVRSFLEVDQISLLVRSTDDGSFCVAFPRRHDPIAPHEFALERFPWLMSQILAKHALLELVDRLPEEASPEEAAMRRLGIESIAVVPINTRQSVAGAFALLRKTRNRAWPANMVSQLQVLGTVLHQLYQHWEEQRPCDMEQRLVWDTDSAPVMIWMSGTDKECTYVNQGWLNFRGTTLEQELGHGWTDGLHPEDLSRFVAEYSKAFDARVPFELECRMRRFDGEFRWIMDYGIPKYGPNGVFCGYTGSCVDITNLKRSEQEMREFSALLIEAEEDERLRIARKLHDDFSQDITILGMELAKLNAQFGNDPSVSELTRQITFRTKHLGLELNTLAHHLHPPHLEILGLPSAIQAFCNESRQRGVIISVKQKRLPSDLPKNVSLCLYRVLQETVDNISQTATESCEVELTAEENGNIIMRITAALNFNVQEESNCKDVSWVRIRERVRMVNGDLRVLPSEGKRTTLEIRIPPSVRSAAA